MLYRETGKSGKGRSWREQSTAFTGLAAFWTFPNGDVNLTGGSAPQRVSVARITPGSLDVLGVPPHHGRTFQQSDTTPIPNGDTSGTPRRGE